MNQKTFVSGGIPLQRGIIYGPVRSRRVGRSLGINLLPTDRKLCAFDCVYCQYGRTENPTLSLDGSTLPSPAEVGAALDAALGQVSHLDAITFSGNGEATLHPGFSEVVSLVLEIRDQLAPRTPVAILTSGARVNDARVREALNQLDKRIVKLDAGEEEVFRAINRPVADLSLEEIISGMRKLEPVILQTLLVKGPQENVSPARVAKLAERIAEIKPTSVQLYTILRPPAEPTVTPVFKDELEEIASRIEAHTKVKVTVY